MTRTVLVVKVEVVKWDWFGGRGWMIVAGELVFLEADLGLEVPISWV